VLMLSGIKLIDFAHADWVIAGAAGAALASFAAWWLVGRLSSPRPRAQV
jgi:hypothetical protein